MLGTWESDPGAQQNGLEEGVLSVGGHTSVQMPWGMSARLSQQHLNRPVQRGAPCHMVRFQHYSPPGRSRFPTLLHMTRKL